MSPVLLALIGSSLAQAPESGQLYLIATDAYGRVIDEAAWTLEGDIPLARSGQEQLEVVVGHYRVAVTAPGFFGTTVDFDVAAARTSEVQVVLDASQVTLTDRQIKIHDKVYFETNKAVIKPESYGLLRQVARVMLEHPEVLVVSVDGHADERGSDSFNRELSARRAAAVRAFLIRQGVSPQRLRSKGYGESVPVAEGSTEEAWAQNRRVEFMIVDRADR